MGKKRVATIQGGSSKKAKELAAKKKKKPRVVERANIHIKSSYNNTLISAADQDGNILAWASAGGAGFKGPRKATPYAATQVVDILLGKLEKVDMKEVHLFVGGIGSGRDSAIRALTGKGLNVTSIKDTTSVPHNGCRPPKRRRV